MRGQMVARHNMQPVPLIRRRTRDGADAVVIQPHDITCLAQFCRQPIHDHLRKGHLFLRFDTQMQDASHIGTDAELFVPGLVADKDPQIDQRPYQSMRRRFRQTGNLRDFAQRQTVLRCRDDFDDLEITLDRSGVMRVQIWLPGLVLLSLNAPRGPFSQAGHSKGQELDKAKYDRFNYH